MKRIFIFFGFINIYNLAFGQIETKREISCGEKTIINDGGIEKKLSISENIVNITDFNYQWYKNGEPIQNATQATFQAKDVGYYSLKLTNKTNSSCQIVSSNAIPIFPSTNNFPPILSENSFATNVISLSSLITSKTEWFLDGKLIVGANSNYSYTYNADGTYKAKQYFENGTVQESNELVVKDGLVFYVMKSTIYDDQDICKPMPNLIATFEKPFFQNEDIKYQWYLNGLAVKDSTFKHFRAVMSGEYYATIFVTSRNQAYPTGKYKIVTEDFPKSLLINKIEDNCGAKALLKVDDSFMQRYTFQSIVWRVDDKEIPNENYPFLKANNGGFYTFSVKYLENINNTLCNYNSFVTFDKKPDFKPNIAYSYAGSGCVVDSFKVSIDYDKNFKYQWTRDGILMSNQNTNEIFVKDKNTYQATISRADECTNITKEVSLKGCTGDSSNTFLALNPPPIFTDKISLYNNEIATLSSVGCSDANLQWVKDNKEIIGATKEEIQVEKSGIYSLKIEKLGCIATSNIIEIGVEPVLALGEKEPSFLVMVYPNPTEEKLFVSIPAELNEPVLVKITDVLGKLINDYDFSKNKNQFLDLKTLPDGIYFLTFETKDIRVVKKVIKKS